MNSNTAVTPFTTFKRWLYYRTRYWRWSWDSYHWFHWRYQFWYNGSGPALLPLNYERPRRVFSLSSYMELLDPDDHVPWQDDHDPNDYGL